MFVVLRSGGKQYKVQPGDVIRVEKLEGQVGAELLLNDILLVGGETLHVGSPLVEGAQVSAVVLKQAKYPKVIIFKKKRRQGYRRTKGHRQPFTELFIRAVEVAGKKVEVDLPAPKQELVSSAEGIESSANKSAGSVKSAKKVSAPKKAVTTKKAAAPKKTAAAKKATAPKKAAASKKSTQSKAKKS